MITLPRLELMAAVIATRLVQFVKSAIYHQSNFPSSHIDMWTKLSSTDYASHTTTPSHLFHTALQRSLGHFQLIRGPLHHLVITLLISRLGRSSPNSFSHQSYGYIGPHAATQAKLATMDIN